MARRAHSQNTIIPPISPACQPFMFPLYPDWLRPDRLDVTQVPFGQHNPLGRIVWGEPSDIQLLARRGVLRTERQRRKDNDGKTIAQAVGKVRKEPALYPKEIVCLKDTVPSE